jgi:hypothetical protein
VTVIVAAAQLALPPEVTARVIEGPRVRPIEPAA